MKPDYSNNHSGNSSIIIYLPPNVNIRTREARAPTMLIKTGDVIDVKMTIQWSNTEGLVTSINVLHFMDMYGRQRNNVVQCILDFKTNYWTFKNNDPNIIYRCETTNYFL